ncbi:hypothetical protein GOODEAATRI_026275, partial [Goodea atripinnis]
YFLHGVCREGSHCLFSHDPNNSKPSTICKYYQRGMCAYGERCSDCSIVSLLSLVAVRTSRSSFSWFLRHTNIEPDHVTQPHPIPVPQFWAMCLLAFEADMEKAFAAQLSQNKVGVGWTGLWDCQGFPLWVSGPVFMNSVRLWDFIEEREQRSAPPLLTLDDDITELRELFMQMSAPSGEEAEAPPNPGE